MSDNIFTPGTDGASNTQAAPEQTVAYWQAQAAEAAKRYNGQNGEYQRLQNQFTALKEQYTGAQSAMTTLNSELGKNQNAVKEWEEKFTSLDKVHSEISGKVSATEQAAATAQAKLDRLELIANKNRDMLDFWDVLKDTPGDIGAFEKSVTGLEAKLQARMQNAVKTTMSGATQPALSGSREGVVDKEAAYTIVDQLIKKGVTSGPEFDSAYQTYMNLSVASGGVK